MKNPITITLIVVGVALLAFGMYSADSVASSFSRFFTGNPTDKSVFLIIGGLACVVAGVVTGAMQRRHHQ